MCMSLIASRYCYFQEPILSRYNSPFEVCSDVLLSAYNKGFLNLFSRLTVEHLIVGCINY